MARNDKANTQLILLVVSAIVATVKFLIEVNKKGLWKEFFISTPIFGGFWYVLHLLYSGQKISLSFFLIALLIAFIVYCIYWSGLFNKSPYKQFSRYEITKNKASWAQQEWWWSLDGWQFEQEVAKIFISKGFNATVTRATGDGGVDIILEKDGFRSIVQCKHHNNPVGPNDARALWGCKDDFQADEVILIASSGITKGAADYINNKPNYTVYTLDDIIEMSQSGQYSYINNSYNHQEEYEEDQEEIEEENTANEYNEEIEEEPQEEEHDVVEEEPQEEYEEEEYEEEEYEEEEYDEEEISPKENIEDKALEISEIYNIDFEDALDMLKDYSYEEVIEELENYIKQN